MNDNVTTLKTETERAKEYRQRIEQKLAELCSILDEAAKDGLRIGFQTGINAFGRYVVAQLEIVKWLA